MYTHTCIHTHTHLAEVRNVLRTRTHVRLRAANNVAQEIDLKKKQFSKVSVLVHVVHVVHVVHESVCKDLYICVYQHMFPGIYI
jgi:hypothetical protein